MDFSGALNLRAAHPLGVRPLGNALADEHSSSRRLLGLGQLAWLGDELLLRLLQACPAIVLARLCPASSTTRAYAAHEELWIALNLDVIDRGGRLMWTKKGTWHAAYARGCQTHCSEHNCNAVGTTSGCKHSNGSIRCDGRDDEAIKVTRARVYSDVLYRSFFFAAVELDNGWFARDNITCIDASNGKLSAKEFVDNYERHSCPVLLKGAAAEWPAMHRWTKDSLLERFGSVRFACGPCELSLSDYYAYAEANLDDRPMFVFDKHFGWRAPEMLEDYSVPEVFHGRDLFCLLGDARPDFRWLLIGNRRSGSKWHVDPNKTSAWNAVVRGRKRWLLLPPGCTPPGVHPSKDGADVTQPLSLVEWFFNFYKELRRCADQNPAWDLREATCDPGDAIFIPCGWWHCVLNLEDDTIAVTQNYASEAHVHSIRRFIREKQEQVSGISGEGRATLAARFDAALAKSRPDLLSEEPSSTELEQKLPMKQSTKTEGCTAFSFWDHLRSTGRPLAYIAPESESPSSKCETLGCGADAGATTTPRRQKRPRYS